MIHLRRITTLLLVPMMICCTSLLSACQTASANDIKEDLPAISSSPSSIPSTGPSTSVLIPLDYAAPSHLEYTLKHDSDTDSVQVFVDADVILPDYAPIVSTIQPIDISYNMIHDLLTYVQNGRLLYDMDECAYVSYKTDIQRSIDRYEWELKMASENDHDAIAFYRGKLEELYEDLKMAPSTVEEANVLLASGEIISKHVIQTGHPPAMATERTVEHRTAIVPFELNAENYDDKPYISTIGQGEDYIASLRFNTAYSSLHPHQHIEYRQPSMISSVPTMDTTLMDQVNFPLDQALQNAYSIVQMIDSQLQVSTIHPIIEYSIYTKSYTPCGYQIVFTRSYDGVLSNYADPSSQYLHHPSPVNQPDYPQEHLFISVLADGIAAISYTSPHKIIDTDTTPAALLPFDVIQQTFNESIIETGDHDAVHIYIHRIQLGMMRIGVPGSSTYQVIPVWDFYGRAISSHPNTDADEDFMHAICKVPSESFLTINAIDGSIIDRQLGY